MLLNALVASYPYPTLLLAKAAGTLALLLATCAAGLLASAFIAVTALIIALLATPAPTRAPMEDSPLNNMRPNMPSDTFSSAPGDTPAGETLPFARPEGAASPASPSPATCNETEQTGEAEEACAALSLADMRAALHERQIQALEPYNLTAREREVVALLADGHTMGSIAEALFISERTVKFHCKNAYDKLGVRNKKELMHLLSKH